MKKASSTIITVFSTLIVLFSIINAHADTKTADRFASFAYKGELRDGINEFKSLAKADPANGEALFGLGALQFFHAIEGLQQDLYRFGAGNHPPALRRRRSFLPVFRVPVPPNTNSEVATYLKTRILLEKFVARLKLAAQSLAHVKDTPAKLPINLTKIALDIDGDGTINSFENVNGVMRILAGRRGMSTALKSEIAFDTADASWLLGYTNVLMSIGNFFLSFDYEKSYDAAFHTVFTKRATNFGRLLKNAKGGPEELEKVRVLIERAKKDKDVVFSGEQRTRLQAINKIRRGIRRDKKLNKEQKKIELAQFKTEYDALRKAKSAQYSASSKIRRLKRRLKALDPSIPGGHGEYETFLDPISFLHSVSWKVVDPSRLKLVRQNLLTVIHQNHTTWRLVLAETDNDREWLPNPRQTRPFASLEVKQETIDAWLQTVKVAEDVLEGKLLVPSLRFGKGINLRRFFEEAKTFDLVLFLTGPNSIQFVEKGPIVDQSLRSALNSPFGRNFNAYMFWFN